MVSVETVAHIIQAAERWDAPSSQLKQRCMDYILSNWVQVVSHPAWEELTSSPQLLLEITRAAKAIVHAPATPNASSGSSLPRPSKRMRKS